MYNFETKLIQIVDTLKKDLPEEKKLMIDKETEKYLRRIDNILND